MGPPAGRGATCQLDESGADRHRAIGGGQGCRSRPHCQLGIALGHREAPLWPRIGLTRLRWAARRNQRHHSLIVGGRGMPTIRPSGQARPEACWHRRSMFEAVCSWESAPRDHRRGRAPESAPHIALWTVADEHVKNMEPGGHRGSERTDRRLGSVEEWPHGGTEPQAPACAAGSRVWGEFACPWRSARCLARLRHRDP
jgi:hypothetical protein